MGKGSRAPLVCEGRRAWEQAAGNCKYFGSTLFIDGVQRCECEINVLNSPQGPSCRAFSGSLSLEAARPALDSTEAPSAEAVGEGEAVPPLPGLLRGVAPGVAVPEWATRGSGLNWALTGSRDSVGPERD